MTSNKYLKYLIPFLAVLITYGVGSFFGSFRTSETPRHWLADLQYSHISVTENFQDGNGTILNPKSYNLDPKKGGENQLNNGLAEARFPVLNYLVSRLSTDEQSQIVKWRAFSFVFYLLAVAASVLLMFEFSKNWLLSLIVGLMGNFTSVVLFAQHAIGPYMLTYLLILLAMYFLVLYNNKRQVLFILLSLFCSGWAMLQGHGSVIFFVASLGFYASSCVNYKVKWSECVLVACLSLIFISLFFYQRFFLLVQNGGLFELNDPFYEGLSGFFEANSKYLFVNSYSVSSTFLSVAIFLGFVYYFFVSYLRKKISLEINQIEIFIVLVIGLNLIYYVLFVTSLVDFDFYALEAMTPMLLLVAMYVLSHVFNSLIVKKIYFFIGLFLVSVMSISSTYVCYQKRFIETEENRVQKSLDNLEQANVFLDSLGIALDERISFVNVCGGNIPMLKSKRKGYVANGVSRIDFQNLLSHDDSRYILSQDQFFMYDVVNSYPEILNKLKLVATNETLSLYEKRFLKDSVNTDVLKDYVQCHNFKDYHEFSNGFEIDESMPKYGKWKVHGEILADSGYQSNGCIAISQQEQFPCTYELNLNEFDKVPTGVVITGMFYTETELRKACFNLSCHGEDGQYFSEFFKVSKKLKGDALNKWVRVSCKVTLPIDEISKNDVVKIFVWNPNGGSFVMDDFSFIFY